MSPCANSGAHRLQRADFHVKANCGFLQSTTSTEKNLKQLDLSVEAKENKTSLGGLLTFLQTCLKSSPS